MDKRLSWRNYLSKAHCLTLLPVHLYWIKCVHFIALLYVVAHEPDHNKVKCHLFLSLKAEIEFIFLYLFICSSDNPSPLPCESLTWAKGSQHLTEQQVCFFLFFSYAAKALASPPHVSLSRSWSLTFQVKGKRMNVTRAHFLWRCLYLHFLFN